MNNNAKGINMNALAKNFINVVRRFKVASALNILGLSIAFAAFMLIMMQVNYEVGFNKSHSKHNRIFRLEVHTDMVSNFTHQAIVSRPMGEKIGLQNPHVEKIAIFNPWGDWLKFRITNNGKEEIFKHKTIRIEPQFLDIFDFEIIDGEAKPTKPREVLICKSFAESHFPGKRAVGNEIKTEKGVLYVAGVYKDFKKNNLLENDVYVIEIDHGKPGWGNFNYHCYYLLDDAENAKDFFRPTMVEDLLKKFDLGPINSGFGKMLSTLNPRLVSLNDIYFNNNEVDYDTGEHGSRMVTILLTIIAFIIVIIASINFNNYSSAISMLRIKSVNIQKVLGCKNTKLRMALVCESVIVAVLAFVIGLVLVMLCKGTAVESFISSGIVLSKSIFLIVGTFILSIISGVLSGLYPAYFITSFSPALVLKGSFGLSPKGRKIRTMLLCVQFISSFALVIFATFIYLQNDYILHSPAGYNTDRLIFTNAYDHSQNSNKAFIHDLKSYSGISEVTLTDNEIGSTSSFNSYTIGYQGKNVITQVLNVSTDFLTVMDIPITEGRNFTEDDGQYEDMPKGVIFNETARKNFNLKLNDVIHYYTTEDHEIQIIGFTADAKLGTFRNAVAPMLFYPTSVEHCFQTYIRVAQEADMQEAIKHIADIQAKYTTLYTQDVSFYEERVKTAYQKETNMAFLMVMFGLLAIFISVVGVFSMVVLEAESKRKEIGMRKVLGSTSGEILKIFSLKYFKMLTICFIISVPVTYWLVNNWFNNFAYHTSMHWWVFAASYITISAVTILIVVIQNLRAANENPVNSVRSE